MSEDIDKIQQLENNVAKQIDEINHKYDMLYKQVEKLSSNVEAILNKIEAAPQIEKEKPQKIKRSIKKSIGLALRKLAVGTVTVVLDIKDRTAEGVASFKEELEDIVAEAHYNSRRKRMVMVEEQ